MIAEPVTLRQLAIVRDIWATMPLSERIGGALFAALFPALFWAAWVMTP